jgi:AbrB family looped-hinge helix DNA binding protein
MLTTIDKAGRVVIPAAVRERLGLVRGATIVVTANPWHFAPLMRHAVQVVTAPDFAAQQRL